MDAQQRSFDQIVDELATGFCTPEINVAVTDDTKFELIEKLKRLNSFDTAAIITVDGLRVEYDNAWGLVRASNTTPNLVLRFEGNTEQDLSQIKAQFKLALVSVDDSLLIPF